MQKSQKSGERSDEKRSALGVAVVPQTIRQRAGQQMRNNLSVGGSAIGVWKVRNYFQSPIAAELLFPVGELLFDFWTARHLLLPDDVVGKVHGNGRKRVG